MRMRARLAIAVGVVAIVAGGMVLRHRQQQSATLAREMQDYESVSRYLSIGESGHALEQIRAYYPVDPKAQDQPIDWQLPTIQALTQLRDGPALLDIYQKFPKKFENREEATLLVASQLIATGRLKKYQKLREEWQFKATKAAAWFDLEVDALLAEGKREEALQALSTHSFEGSADVGRLSRLAILRAPNNLKAAWNYLTEARAKDPNNSSLLAARAEIFELTDRPELARQEYLRAVQKDPSSVALIDQLGEFYRRHGHYVLAIENWCCGLALPRSDTLWIKTLFWSRVVYPLPVDWSQQSIPVGHLKPFIAYLLELQKDRFWHKATFKQIPNYSQFLATQQATYWLRLAQALKEGKEKQAALMLAENPFRHVLWDADLHNALQQVVNYRIARSLQMREGDRQTSADADRHHFFRELERLAADPSARMPAQTRNLLLSPYAIPSTFLAAGWLEAALSYPIPEVLPRDLPDWLAFAYTQAIRFNRSPQEALEFAAKQHKSPPLQLLMGELLIATGNFDSGLSQLAPLLRSDSDIGLRAAWVTSLIHLRRKQFEKAKQTIIAHYRLASNLIGKETLARIEMEAGNITRADRLYQELEQESVEAKFYLARRAYEQKDWSRAALLTHQLLEEFPDNPQLRSELIKIKNLDQKLNQTIDRGDLYESSEPFHLDTSINRSVAAAGAHGCKWLT